MTKLKWEKVPTGLGWSNHVSGAYTCEPEDLDFGEWCAYYDGESIGTGSWQQCRSLCQSHSDGGQK